METAEVQPGIEPEVDAGVVERLSSFLKDITKANEVLTLSVSELSSMLFVQLNELAVLYKNLGLKPPSEISAANVEQWVEKFLTAIHRGDIPASASPSLEYDDPSGDITSGTDTETDLREHDNDDATGQIIKHESPLKPPPSPPKSESPPPVPTQKSLKPSPPSSPPLIIQKPEAEKLAKREEVGPKPIEDDDAAFRFFAHHVGQTLKREHKSRLGQPVSQTWLEGKLLEKWNSLPESEKVTWERASRLSR
ncbi:unnamed protein product [Schistocephalus solidus]|uniref:HMG box domain-containing protein n=1 Tax=Schistocephalus solidus TaxID=70667 RepID=A0A183T284_SCHSO|nr:unnamed protein product [Schistocephalus solidus]